MTLQLHPEPQAPSEQMGFWSHFQRAFVVCTVIVLILLIPKAENGLDLETVLRTTLSSYGIGLAAVSTISLLLRVTRPFVARRRWPPIRAWALASLIGNLIATISYSLIYGFFFVDPANRIGFISFWLFMGMFLSIGTSALFWAVERVQQELQRGRRALLLNAALARELSVARAIQQQMLPKQAPTVQGLLVAGGCYPAREVGGDLLSYECLAGNKLSISVGDVSGKSVGAAMLMGVTLGALQAEIHDHEQPAQVLDEVDRWLHTQTGGKAFVALSNALIMADSSTMILASAGQLMPLLRRNGTTSFIELPPALPLGMGIREVHQQQMIKLQPHDLILFYTDGIVEAQNEAGEMWGFERLIALIDQLALPMTPQAIVTNIMETITTYAANREQHDDITLVVVEIQAQGSHA